MHRALDTFRTPGVPCWSSGVSEGHEFAAYCSCLAYPVSVTTGQKMSQIVFTTRLTAEDWDEAMHGWRCQVLNVPGAIIEAVYVDGNRIDTARYEVLAEHTFIRWMGPDQPHRAAASIKLTETLSLGAETERWKRLAILLPVVATVLAAIISGAGTYLSRAPVPRASNAPARLPSSQVAQTLVAKTNGATVNAIACHNSHFMSALAIEFGKDYLSRFEDDSSSRYFSLPVGAQIYNVTVRLILPSRKTDVQPVISIYNASRKKLFSRYYEKSDGATMEWTVPVTSGTYIIEVNPNASRGNFAQFLLRLSPG